MATYAIGDVQGCFDALQRLVARIAPGPGDKLWLVGDLVNRGPDSLAVLRWAKAQGDRVVCVLGNHDLHLLGRALGVRWPGKRDTLDDVLRAPDREDLIEWLRQRPLLHREGNRILIHAGLHPAWTPDEAEARARSAENLLRGKRWHELLGALGKDNVKIDAALATGLQTMEWLTRARVCERVDSEVRSVSDFTGTPQEAPKGCVPWFEYPGRRCAEVTVVCGHWAALGLRVVPGLVALDTGCVWGQRLTAVRLEDKAVISVGARLSTG
jgi:bis(5'-nucleosyl)-tetraphosphatase (symmetrical)